MKHEQKCSDAQVANLLLFLMFCGIFFKLDSPYAHFGTEDVGTDIIHPIIREGI